MSEEKLCFVSFLVFIYFNFSKNKPGDKRKRSEDFSAEEPSKKAKLSEDDEDSPATPESVRNSYFSNSIS